MHPNSIMGLSNHMQKAEKVHAIHNCLWKKVVMLLEFVVPSLRVTLATQMTNDQSFQHRLDELMELEEDCMMVGFSQVVEKE
jgi:hypothetical protein